MVGGRFTKKAGSPVELKRLWNGCVKGSHDILPKQGNGMVVKLLQGDGGVGTVRQIFSSVAGNNSTNVIQKVDRVDEYNLVYVFSHVEGGLLGRKLASASYEVKFKAKAVAGSFLTYTVHYDNLPGVSDDEAKREIEANSSDLFKLVDSYLIANPTLYCQNLETKRRAESTEEDANNWPYECRDCRMKFPKRQALGGHMNKHRKFPKQQGLGGHMSRHSQGKKRKQLQEASSDTLSNCPLQILPDKEPICVQIPLPNSARQRTNMGADSFYMDEDSSYIDTDSFYMDADSSYMGADSFYMDEDSSYIDTYSSSMEAYRPSAIENEDNESIVWESLEFESLEF